MESTTTPGFGDVQLPVRKMQRLLAYIDNLGFDPAEIAHNAGLDVAEILDSTPDESIPSLYYALIYKELVVQLQRDDRVIPWAAGLGSDAFRMMCYSIISCRTLGEALQRAQQFDALLYPIVGHKIEVSLLDRQTVVLEYIVDESRTHRSFAARHWSLEECDSVTRSSGIETWFGLCGWLIGRSIELKAVTVSGIEMSTGYSRNMSELYLCPVQFDAEKTTMQFASKYLDFRIVHDSRSLEEFLETGPHQLWALENRAVSTSTAIRTLLGNDFREGVPSFEDMAANMHMSSSTLRRHLLSEGTSYQKIKDESRREIAIEMLCFSDARISEISEHVGFADTSSFVRSFRTWTGMTPKAYREHAKPMLRSDRSQFN